MKEEKGSTNQDEGYIMGRWELFLLNNIQEWYERKNNIKVHARGITSFVYYMHWKPKFQDYAEVASSHKILVPLVNIPGSLLILIEKAFKWLG